MKREIKTYPKIKNIYPFFFWKQCDFCNKEFVREKGFSIKDFRPVRSNMLSETINYYCCNECAADENKLQKIIKERKAMRLKPPRYIKNKEVYDEN